MAKYNIKEARSPSFNFSLTGEVNATVYTSPSNSMRVSWQPNGGTNVRGMMVWLYSGRNPKYNVLDHIQGDLMNRPFSKNKYNSDEKLNAEWTP